MPPTSNALYMGVTAAEVAPAAGAVAWWSDLGAGTTPLVPHAAVSENIG